MAPLPASTILGLSAMSFGTIIGYKAFSTLVADPSSSQEPLLAIFAIAFGLLFIFVGIIAHFDCLKSEPGRQSGAGMFLGLNAGFIWLLYVCEESERVRLGLVAFAPALVGMVLPVLMAEGDVVYKRGEGQKVDAGGAGKGDEKEGKEDRKSN